MVNTKLSSPKFDLTERCLQFSKLIVQFTANLPKNPSNQEYSKQLLRSAGSIGANYIEANDALGEKDFAHRLRIARKEAKETKYWLQLLIVSEENVNTYDSLLDESQQLINILSSIINKVSTNN